MKTYNDSKFVREMYDFLNIIKRLSNEESQDDFITSLLAKYRESFADFLEFGYDREHEITW